MNDIPDILDKVEIEEHLINKEYNDEKTKEDQEDEIELSHQGIQDQEQRWGRA